MAGTSYFLFAGEYIRKRSRRHKLILWLQLKKLINGVVEELSTLGLDPNVLNELLRAEDDSQGDNSGAAEEQGRRHPHAVYELISAVIMPPILAHF